MEGSQVSNVHHMKNKTPEERRAIARKSFATRIRNREADEHIRRNAALYGNLFAQINYLEQNFEVLQRMEMYSKIAMSLNNKSLPTDQEIADKQASDKWST